MPRGDATALAGLIVFIVLFLAFTAGGVYFYRRVEAPDEGAGTGGLRVQVKEKVKELRKQRGVVKEKEVLLGEQLAKLDQAIQLYNMYVTDVARERKDAHLFLQREEIAKSETSTAGKIKTNIQDVKQTLVAALRTEKNTLDGDHSRQLSEYRKRIDGLTKDIQKEEDRKKRLEEEFRTNRDILDSHIVDYEDQLARMTARDVQRAEMTSDGKLLKVEEATKLAIISLGTSQGVRKGMRFEVFQIKEGNRRVHKGLIEVKTVDEETSAATILIRVIQLPRCPTTGYVASRPEERFSPYDSGGQSGLKVVKLLARPKIITVGMNPDDPMAEGDLVYNPFFNAKKKLRFCVKGEKIEYSQDEIVRTIKEHGGVIDDDVTATTDYLVSQRWSQEHVKKARELGVPVLYEFDIFDFLRHY